MYNKKMLSNHNVDNFNFRETKRNVYYYFKRLEELRWELVKLNTPKGLTSSYDFETQYQKQPYTPIGKDVFTISVKELKEEELVKYISNYYWAKSLLSDIEQLYISENFIKRKYDGELADLLGFNNIESRGYRRLKKNAIYKFADFLNLVVENKTEGEKK